MENWVFCSDGSFVPLTEHLHSRKISLVELDTGTETRIEMRIAVQLFLFTGMPKTVRYLRNIG